MTAVSVGRICMGPAPKRIGPGVWCISDLTQARRVCADEAAFRAAQPSELVPGISRSFFLATDTATAEDRTRFRNALAAALSPQRLDRLTDSALQPTARRLAHLLPLRRAIDLTETFVRPYTRQVAYRLAGLPQGLAVELAATIKVAANLVMRSQPAEVIQGLLASVWAAISCAVTEDELATDSLPGFALAQGLIREQEVPLILVPILEMAVLDVSSALTIAAVTRMSSQAPELQSALREGEAAKDLVWASAVDLEGLNVTRVAREACIIGGVPVPVGAKLILDISAANQKAHRQSSCVEDRALQGDHLAFGRGQHACMGRGLALAVASTAVSELARRGSLSPVPSIEGGFRLDVVS